MTERQLLTVSEVAEMLRLDPDTLSGWRARLYGPESFKVGRRVVYEAAVVEAWIKAQKDAERRRQAELREKDAS